ncbi:HU family DNA-binding protein [Viscerimonas tarda]
MNKRDLIIAASKKSGMTQSAIQQSLEAIFECMIESLEKGEQIAIQKFGIFSVKERNERNSMIPYTGEHIIIPPRKAVKFKLTRQSSLNEKGNYKRI